MNSFGLKTLLDIAPKAFKFARENTRREEKEYRAIIGLRRGRIKRLLKEEGFDEAEDFDKYMGREDELLEKIRPIYDRRDEAADAYRDLARPIKDWKCHMLAFSGWTGSLYDQKEVTPDVLNSMLDGVEDYENGTVTLIDGRVFRGIKGDEGYYSGDDGSVIAGIDLIRTDKDGNPVKVECRLGYVVVSGVGSYDGMPY